MRRFPQRQFVTAAAILLPLCLAAPVAGQGDRGGSSGGASSLGQSGLGQSSFGQSGLGGSALGGSGLGQSSLGQSGFGQSGQSGGGLLTGDTGYIGRGAADMQAFFGGLNEAFGGASRSRSPRDRGEANPSGLRRPPVRVKLRIDPDMLRKAAAAGSLETSLAGLSGLLDRRGLDGVQMDSDGGTVRLTGAVASESERLLAEKLAEIEPGVRRVENELRVLPRLQEALPAPR